MTWSRLLWSVRGGFLGCTRQVQTSRRTFLDPLPLPAIHPAALWACGTATVPLLTRHNGHSDSCRACAWPAQQSQWHHVVTNRTRWNSFLHVPSTTFHNVHHKLNCDSRFPVRLDCTKLPTNCQDAGNSMVLPSKSSPHRAWTHKGLHQGLPPSERSTRRYLKILTPHGLVNASPSRVQPYLRLMRVDRPIGTWLLYLPCMFSITLATPVGQFPDPAMLALFGMGAFLMRGAGCTINDMWDKDFDAKVARTQDRPLACGQMSNLQALTFLGLQLSGALAILLTFNWYTIALGASSMLLVVTYPLMKRVTYWPQAFLGLTFNWGALTGWSAVQGVCDWSVVLPLYASCFAWTIVYDTIYAHQDKEDDILIGVKSTALKFGDKTKSWLCLFTFGMVSGLTATGVMCDQHWLYYAGVAAVASRVMHQIYSVDLDDREDCGRKFRQTRNIGLMFWVFILLANLQKKKEPKQTTTT